MKRQTTNFALFVFIFGPLLGLIIGNIIGDIKVGGRYWTILRSNARFTI